MTEKQVLGQLNRVIKNKKYVDFTDTQRLGKFIGTVRRAIKIASKVEFEEQKIESESPKIKIERLKVVNRTSIPPGKILIFNYEDEKGTASIRKILTVNSQRTGNGTYFLSTQYNKLLNGYDLNTVTAELLVEILDKLYENSEACTYQKNPTELQNIVPTLLPEEFRTYNIDNMSGVHIFNIIRQK